MDGSLEEVFTRIYRNGSWTSHDNVESRSGRGSTLWRTEALRRELPALLQRLGVWTLVDAACGDFNWLSTVEVPLKRYHGIDVVADLVAANNRLYANDRRSFVHGDIRTMAIPDCDAVLCRDCLNHLSFADIEACLANIRRTRAHFVMLTTHPSHGENLDCKTGEWRMLNLRLPPFDLPEPVELVLENEDLGKYLGVWHLGPSGFVDRP